MSSSGATLADSEQSVSGQAPSGRSVVQPSGETNCAQPARPERIPWDVGLFGHWRISIQQRRFICMYFSHLDAEYEALCPDEYKLRVASTVAALRLHHAERPGWDLNHRYEYLVMGGLPLLILKQRCAIYRERLLVLLGDVASLPTLAQAFPTVDNNDVEGERLTALGMLSEIQRLRNVRSEFERLRNRLFILCLGLLGLPALGYLLVPLIRSSIEVPVWAQVGTAGLLGGYFSVLLRLAELRWCAEYNANYQQVDRLFYNIAANFGLSMLEGGVGATILYTLFLAGILTGDLFPKFHAVANGVAQALNTSPVDGADTAKLLVWAVIAGFSERLVPDFLSSLANDRAKAAAKANRLP
jgi:hypothetical protein